MGQSEYVDKKTAGGGVVARPGLFFFVEV